MKHFPVLMLSLSSASIAFLVSAVHIVVKSLENLSHVPSHLKNEYFISWLKVTPLFLLLLYIAIYVVAYAIFSALHYVLTKTNTFKNQ